MPGVCVMNEAALIDKLPPIVLWLWFYYIQCVPVVAPWGVDWGGGGWIAFSEALTDPR